mgnify:CR=1 FL=1
MLKYAATYHGSAHCGSTHHGAYRLQATLDSVPPLVASGKAQVSATRLDTEAQLGLLERGLFGEDLAGYTSHVRAARPGIDTWRMVLLLTTFALPVVVGGLAVVACVLRRGALALHSGQAMLVLLPWVVLLGASVELPAAVLLRDGCDQIEDFTYRTLGEVRVGRLYPNPVLPPSPDPRSQTQTPPAPTLPSTSTLNRRVSRFPRWRARASRCTAT